MRRNVRTGVARDILRLAIIGVWAAEPRDVSLLHVLFYIRSAGSLEILTDTEGGAQQDRVVGGSQLISLRMAEQLGADGGRARHPGALDPPQRRRGRRSTSDRRDGRGAAGDRRDPADPRRRIAYDPPLPARRDGLSQRMAQGSVVKCMAVYERPFWRDRGPLRRGRRASPARSRSASTTPRPTAAPGSCSASSRARRRARRRICPSRSAAALVAECFARLFGPEAAEPDRLRRPGLGRRGVVAGLLRRLHAARGLDRLRAALREPIGPLHWAGAETATVWNGYMDGAVGSGQEAASAAITALA